PVEGAGMARGAKAPGAAAGGDGRAEDKTAAPRKPAADAPKPEPPAPSPAITPAPPPPPPPRAFHPAPGQAEAAPPAEPPPRRAAPGAPGRGRAAGGSGDEGGGAFSERRLARRRAPAPDDEEGLESEALEQREPWPPKDAPPPLSGELAEIMRAPTSAAALAKA